jgi:hypothetical protein
MTPIPSGRIGASLSFLWSVVGGGICMRIYNTGAIALNYFQRRKRSFRSMRISFRLSISRSYFTSRESGDIWWSNSICKRSVIHAWRDSAVIHQVPRAFDGITAATAAQFLSFAFVRPSVYISRKKKNGHLLVGGDRRNNLLLLLLLGTFRHSLLAASFRATPTVKSALPWCVCYAWLYSHETLLRC